MGTNQPLTIYVWGEWFERPEVQDLIKKGHFVVTMETDQKPDLILHPNAWRWGDHLWEHLDVALKEARKGQPKKGTTNAKAETKAKRRSRKGSE